MTDQPINITNSEADDSTNNSTDTDTGSGSRTIAQALAQRESHQMEAIEDLVARACDEVAAQATGVDVDAVQKMLADRLRAHLPVDSKANKAWLRERAKLIVSAGKA